jgi:ATP-dependent helicase/DNAse subunit B
VPITLVTGPANAGKVRVVLDALRAHHARGEEPLLVVPTRADVEYYRRELARDGLVLGARVERFQGLLSEIVSRAGPAERAPVGPPLGPLARERVLAAALRRVSPEHAPTPGIVRALAGLVAELETDRVTPARLQGALAAWATEDPAHAPRARELTRLFDEYHRALAQLVPPREDPEGRAARALDALRRRPALWGGTPVLLYGFDDLLGLQLDAIETLGVRVAARVTVSLTYEPGRVAFAGRGDTFQRLLPLVAEHRRVEARAEYYATAARPALHHLERHLFEPHPPPPVSAGGAVRLLEGGGERAELELIAQDIRELLARGMRPAEIAVAHRSPPAIAELLGEVFAAHRIPHLLPRRIPFAHTTLGRALLGLLATAFEAPDVPPAELLAWLRAPGVLRRPELIDAFERRIRRSGVSTAAAARSLWESEHWPLETVDRLQEAARESPIALIDRTTRELEHLFCAPRTRAAEVLRAAQLPQARALAAGRAALEQLRELARACRPTSARWLAPDASELIATLRSLELVVGGDGPAEAVAVLDPLSLRARRVRALFLCGLQDGTFPAPPRPEPYLSEEERRGLAQVSGLRVGLGRDPRHSLAAERYLLYAALSRPEELLVLSWHTADDDGRASPHSLFVEDVCDLFAPDLHEARTRRALGEVGELRSSELTATRASPTAASIAALRDPRVLAALGERMWSASGLQRWAGCPVQWFVESLLVAHDLDPEPEPLARGGLAHAALADVLKGLRAETGSARLTAPQLPRARELLREALAAHAEEYPLSTASERVPGIRRRLEADLERYLEHAAACSAEGSHPPEPTHMELSFGFPDEPGGMPALDLGEGVRVRGRIDRVDLAPAGGAVVYDYKSAHAPPPDKWLAQLSFQIPLYMCAVEELLGVPAVGGFYQPLSGRDLRARGVLAEGQGVELDCVRGDAREAADVRVLVAEIIAAARHAATEARAGALEARPRSCGFGGSGCRYPTICRCES